MRTTNLVLAVGLFAAMAACKKKEAPPIADTTPIAAPAPPAAAVTALELGRHVGSNKRVSDTTSTFARRDTMFLAVVTENTAPGATLLAKWTFQTGQTVDSTAQPVAAPDAASPVSVTNFRLIKPSAWPVGKYKVEVWLDGVSKGARDFEVKK